MSKDMDYDFMVIGAGSGGVRAARMAASYGAKVAVVEERYLGGTCVNVGCVPKKLFVYASHYGEDFHDAAGFGWQVEKPRFQWDTLRDNKNNEIERLNQVYGRLLDDAGVERIDGTARLIDPHSVKVGSTIYTAKTILIATGSWPFIADFPGKEHVISSNEIFYLEHLPKRALVIGGGYIAVEFAGILNGLGVETHLAYRGPQTLRGFDQDVRDVVQQELIKKGINIQLNTNVLAVTKRQDNALTVALSNDKTVCVDLVLSATGRVAKTDGLGLEAVGVACRENGSVIVNDYYQTNVSSIYAVGDVIGKIQLTPVALAEGMVVAKNLFLRNQSEPLHTVDYSNIATAVFCQPNIGTVGLSEEQALETNGDIRIYKSTFTHMKHTLSGNSEKTFMKLIVDNQSDKVIGAHMVGADAGEIIQGLAVAIKAGATKAHFDQTIGIHPTAAEEFVTMREPVAVHKIKKI